MHLRSVRRSALTGPVWLVSGFLLAGALFAGGVVGAQPAVPAYSGPHPRTPVDKIPAGGEMQNFTLIGHNPLLDPEMGIARSQNGGIAAVRDCVYVGTNIGMQPTVIVDMADMANPKVVGPLPGGIQGRGTGVEAIEAVPDLNLLVNTTRTAGALGFDPPPADANTALLIYDVTDCRNPVLVSRWNAPNVDLHYMSLWRDPNQPDRVLVNTTFSNGDAPDDGIDIRVIDLTGCPKNCNPTQVAEWGLRAQFEIPPVLDEAYDGGVYRPTTQTHDVTSSLDGTRMYVAQLHFGYFEIDSSALANKQPCDPSSPRTPDATGHCLTVLNNNLAQRLQPFGVGNGHTHGIVRLPGRPYVSMAHEDGTCPYSGINMVYIGNQESFAPGAPGTGLIRGDLFPDLFCVFALPENQVDRCPKPGQAPGPNTYGPEILRGRMDVHDVIAFPDLMFATWYGAGLRAIDVTNPAAPFETGYFFNKPEPDARWCYGASQVGPNFCGPIENDTNGRAVQQRPIGPLDIDARSYPIVMNGYVVYSDAVSGLYVLKYNGPHADEVPTTGLCISHNPGVTSPGYEPCAPYKTN